ncbi:hypothetical protein L1049_003082 [Liquidambar formosana]|uniref:Uncharacterized protein n=1 Tax=Liquidambar formosana TaxID=63359 RepID=A0AAP0NJG7_LIQFO
MDLRMFTTSTFGSVVYCAGIDKCHGCKVRYFDVSPPEDGWKKVAWMHEKDRIPTRWFSMESSMSWVGTLACAEKSFWNDKRYLPTIWSCGMDLVPLRPTRRNVKCRNARLLIVSFTCFT